MRITVLGKSPAWQDAGGACSGYLVEGGGTRLLLDCGPGVFAKLRALVDYAAVDAVVISHLHADHVLDLVPYASGLTYAPRQQPVAVGGHPGTREPARPALLAPAGAREAFAALCGSVGMREEHVASAFGLAEYDAGEPLEIGALRLRFCAVPHYVPTWAIEVAGDGGRLTYGADCAPNEALCEFARDTDLLLAEATLPRPERDGPRGHLTPREAGEHGARAHARRLVITHISDELDLGWAREAASEAYGAAVEVAREGAVYELG